MSAAEVRQHLDRFTALANARGLTLMSRVRAGLTADVIRGIEDETGVVLTPDAREVWLWHDGVDTESTQPFWGTGYWFPDLRTAIRLGRQNLEIRNSGDVHTHPDSAWIMLGGGSTNVVIDVTVPGRGASPVYLNDPSSAISDYPIVTLAERLGWWCWAIENGVHRVSLKGDWEWDFEKVPSGPERNLM